MNTFAVAVGQLTRSAYPAPTYTGAESGDSAQPADDPRIGVAAPVGGLTLGFCDSATNKAPSAVRGAIARRAFAPRFILTAASRIIAWRRAGETRQLAEAPVRQGGRSS